MRFLVAGLSLGLVASASVFAQAVISSHSGVVQYVEGRAFLNDKPVDLKFGQFPDIKENQEFRTEDGRAEILLTPGVFLRIGENSSVRMLSTKLTDTRVEVLSGSAIVESSEMPKDNAVELVYKKDSIRLAKQGLYRLDSEPAQFAVFEGEAVVTDPSGQLTLHGGKRTNLSGVLMAESFDRKPDSQDALYRWSDRRASYVAQANVVSASTSGSSYSGSGYGYGSTFGFNGLNYGFGGLGYGYGFYNPLFQGGWAFNPIFGMYTYLPYSGFGYSPFGYTYYSPVTVGYAPYYGGSGYTYGGGARVTTVANRGGVLATHRGAVGSMGAIAASSRSFGSAHAGSFGGARGGSFGGSFGGARGGSAVSGGGHVGGFSGGGHAGGSHR
ncbi:MAG TPA: hypothetical protein VFW44_09110 [Bryobacteraceae bacterium]|nr:hypothetical protein [Bryobacteraceae bacterium]